MLLHDWYGSFTIFHCDSLKPMFLLCESATSPGFQIIFMFEFDMGWAGSSGARKMRFPAYASHEELGTGLKKGLYFKGPIRVNAHDRSQAYITLAGLPSDLMIRVSPTW